MGKRSFDELSVVATGVQGFEDRFGKRRRHEHEDVPPMSEWRCNLTGLSQEHNLYFVTYGREIYVYVPQFPTQTITEKPILIVPSQPTKPGLSGSLDSREPHTINNLIVQYLGNDEVVATVRDDGDVDALLVRHVLQAIERRAEAGNGLGVVANELRPVFQSNVGISAWGLAIHQDARILATSSNAHEVRVFKFGLLQEDGHSPLHASDESPDTEGSDSRTMDVTQRVLNGNANIPCIAFCNTGDDPEGRWLLTTDVSGYCRVMDLHCQSDDSPTAQKFRFGKPVFTRYGGTFDQHNAGWTIMFLDRRSFQPARSFHDAVGIAECGSLPGMNGNGRAWDLSDTVDTVPDNSPAFTRSKPQARRDSGSERRRRTAGEGRESAEPLQTPMDEDEVPDTHIQRDTSESIFQELVSQVTEESMDDELMSTDPDYDAEISTDEYVDHDVALIEDDADPDDEGTEDSVSYTAMYGGRRIFGNQPYFYHQNGICDDLPCPILHASVKNVYLLQPSKQKLYAGAFSPPVVGLANPLRQAVPQFSYLNMFDRLNMSAYIPALGVVVLASQKGRAVVLALTKLKAGSATRYPSEMRENLGPPKTNYAMRVESILPFAHQEAENQRPYAPLHGIAVGPIQGTEGLREERKRWRLLMMYQDHSVFSYEIKRRRARDSGVGLEVLVP
ncbi:hypothetical protein LTR91_021804 [Friedmanniomyces endolithicus]|uniref:Uncharacterized protein n=2 Tax=Dothideomycetidae TaxID=451867 RepID=A0AAN6H643_9PEZI|nr:hypothetical protein LTR94_021374 [Friedmanniomyces endolithicus]KAK5142012.1 hypothetical protein LTR32_005553 [Rachicladosporium monterosium]KAK0769628.1 hypothetical protein LTR59_016931 [Friedmanniomyces endolithicus]KAK0772975.1 hypothetical protein LTR38_016731 [Friedmanniomyces endolithicus]KAK0777179.1 hypothetical protein LTR75_016027 [Friedmanniomyces endolithicus]